MKTISKTFILFLFLSILVFMFSCRKQEYEDKEDYYFIKNNLKDTVNLIYNDGLLNYNVQLPPNKSKSIYFPRIIWINLYKNDSLIIRFKNDSLPYNYSVDFYDINNWTSTYKIVKYNVSKYGDGNLRVQVYHIFNIDSLNIFNYK